jgi:hypothetical protein
MMTDGLMRTLMLALMDDATEGDPIIEKFNNTSSIRRIDLCQRRFYQRGHLRE